MGCFVPDLPYFFFLTPHGFEGHTLRGMFLFDLPASLIVLWLFHSFMKQPALIFLPDGVRRRLKAGAYSFLPAGRLALIAISILIGSATHILWDAFTHSFYWPYRHWGFLRMNIELPIAGHLAMFNLLQYTTSAAGLLLVAAWVLHWYRTTDPVEHPIARPFRPAQRSALIETIPVVAIVSGLLHAKKTVGWEIAIRPLTHFAADTVVTAIAFFALELLACGMLLRVSKPAGEASYGNS